MGSLPFLISGVCGTAKRLRRRFFSALALAYSVVTKLGSSFAFNRRSRCGLMRGSPVLSSHFSPGLAPHVEQRTARAFFGSEFLMLMASRSCTKHPAKNGQF